MGFSSHTEQLAGLTAHWIERYGEGPPVVLLHCSLASFAHWSPIFARLDKTIPLAAPDLPGHGDTSFDPRRDLQAQTAELTDALISRIGGPVHLVGHSFGGTAALRVARDYPKRILSLTLFEPVLFGLLDDARHPGWDDELVKLAELADAFAQSKDKASEVFINRWGGPGGWAAMPEEGRDEVRARIDLIPRTDVALYGPSKQRVNLRDIKRMKHPTILMRGKEALPVTHAIHEVLARHMNVIDDLIVEGAGHMGPITHPDTVVAAIHAQVERTR